MLLANVKHLNSVSAVSEHLTAPKTSPSDHLLDKAMLTLAITFLLFSQPSETQCQLSQQLL